MIETKPIIMVIDDQIDFIESVKLILEAEGYEVWSASDGQNALDELRKTFNERQQYSNYPDGIKHLPDLILADIMMPGMDGYELREHIYNNPVLNHIPFVFLTAKTDIADIRYGKEQGADDYLVKPCQPEDLLATVRGKLKRSAQRRTLFSQIAGNPDSPSAIGLFIIAAILITIIVLTIAITLVIIA